MKTLLASFGLFALVSVAALTGCGGGGSSCTASACGPCQTGAVADDKCINDTWVCSCITMDMQPADLSVVVPQDLALADLENADISPVD